MPSSTITLTNTMDWAKRFNFGRNSALGTGLQPAITNANTIMQIILGAPFTWRWNRVVTGFITVNGQQDYYIFNWLNGTPVKLGWMLVDANGFGQTVTTAGTTAGSIPSFNSSLGGTTTDGSAVWTNLGSIGTPVSPTYSFGWIEKASIKDPAKGWIEMQSKIVLGLDSSTTRPTYIAAQGDDGTGNISFRLLAAPNAAYPVAITLQQKPPLFTTTTSITWAPIPDEYSRIYNWGFLSLFFLFSDDPRFQLANQKFVTGLLSANEGLTETERNIFLGNWQYITGQPIENANRMAQGEQSRGV